MRSKITRNFRQRLGKLPLHIQKQAVKAYEMFLRDPNSVNFKPIKGMDDLYSAQVNDDYRVLGDRVENELIIWDFIGSHAQYMLYIIRRRGGGD